MELHKKQSGALGESKIIGDLISRGCEVFIEFGDNSSVDMIALFGGKPVKIQVKAITSKKGIIFVHSYKSGPGYKYRYTPNDCDLFAIYVLDRDIIFYLTIQQLLIQKTGLSIRIDPSKNGQTKNLRMIDSFKDTLDMFK